MAFAVLDELVRKGDVQMNYETAEKNYIKAIRKGLFKIMSKMGISTIRSYRGAKIFEAVGVSEELLRSYFGTQTSSIGGIRLEEVARDAIALHDAGFAAKEVSDILPHNGLFSFRKDGERHAWNPETISTLQLATRLGSYKKFKEFTSMVDGKDSPLFLRDFFGHKRNPIDIEKVEPVENIVKHFVTGAMSFGAISKEAHEALALAMNKLGARSNTGEGGEDSDRITGTYQGISLCSKTKQIASGRFGVTAEYLVHAEEIQIKVAQGAKPGEGGQIAQQNIPSRQEVREFESHVIKPDEAEKTQMYRCDCGKESCLPVSSTICPKCGRQLNDNHKFNPTHKSGCASVILLLILVSAFTLLL